MVASAENGDLMPLLEAIYINNIYNKIAITICFNDPHRTQIDNRTKCSVTNNIDLLQDTKRFDQKDINYFSNNMIGNITIIKYKIKFKQSPDIAVNDLADKTDVNSTSVIKWDLENPSCVLMNWFCRHVLNRDD